MDTQYLQLAIEISNDNITHNNGGPFGAVIVKGGVIVSTGANKVTTKLDPTAHAEIEAIRLACQKLDTFNLEGCILYTSCEPCPMCLGAVYWSRLDKVFYANSRTDAADLAGFDDQLIYDELNVTDFALRKVPMIRSSDQHTLDLAKSTFHAWATEHHHVKY